MNKNTKKKYSNKKIRFNRILIVLIPIIFIGASIAKFSRRRYK